MSTREVAVEAAAKKKPGKETKSCAKCRNHSEDPPPLKGHKDYCRYRDCPCERCLITSTRQQKMRVSVAERRKKDLYLERVGQGLKTKPYNYDEKKTLTLSIYQSIKKLMRKFNYNDSTKELLYVIIMYSKNDEDACKVIEEAKRVMQLPSGVLRSQPVIPIISQYSRFQGEYVHCPVPYRAIPIPSCYQISIPPINTFYYQPFYHEDGEKSAVSPDNLLTRPPRTPSNQDDPQFFKDRMRKRFQTDLARRVTYKKIGMSSSRKPY